MRIKRSDAIKTLFSTLVSLMTFIFISFKIQDSTVLFTLEISFLLFMVCEIFLVYEDRFSPLAFLFISFGVGILDVIFVGLGLRFVSYRYTISIYEKTLGIIIIWILFFFIGYFFTDGKSSHKDTLSKVLNKASNEMILLIFGIMYCYVIFKVITTIIKLGSIKAAITNSAVFRYDNQAYLSTLLALSSIVPICFMEKGKKILAIITFLVMFTVLLLTGRRGLIINYLFIPLIIYMHYKKRKVTNIKAVALGIVFVFIIIIIGNARNQQSSSYTSNKLISILTNLTVSTKLGESLPDTIFKIDNGIVKYGGFKYSFRGIVGIIPRVLWHNKPSLIDHSVIISNDIYNTTSFGRPVGPYGFSYYCFGMLGNIFIGLLTGIITKKFYFWMINNKDYIHIFIYSLSIVNVINIIKPESQLSILVSLIIVFSSVFFSMLMKKLKA